MPKKDNTISKMLSIYDEILDVEILKLLLVDRSSGKNIIWGTDMYPDFNENDCINVADISGKKAGTIKPRIEKGKSEREDRIKNKGEVFTPSWVCNAQNNKVDDEWFGYVGAFNTETENGWTTNPNPVKFPEGKTWKDYVELPRIEITCGEAPYLVSRYDTVSGEPIEVGNRIGLLDRKLRVVGENTATTDEWYEWALKAVQSIYGYDWQGDNVFLARRNVLFTYMDYFFSKFNELPNRENIFEVLNVISWNIWQMDGLKFVIPNSCKTIEETNLLGETIYIECPGCRDGTIYGHNGIICHIQDWKENKVINFIDCLK